MILCIGDTQEIPVLVVRKSCQTLPRIGNLRHPIEPVVSKLCLEPPWIGQRGQARHGVIHPMCCIAEWVCRGDQVPVAIIGKRGRWFCGDGPLHARGLTETIVGNGRHMREWIFHRQQVPVGAVIGEFGDLRQRIRELRHAVEGRMVLKQSRLSVGVEARWLSPDKFTHHAADTRKGGGVQQTHDEALRQNSKGSQPRNRSEMSVGAGGRANFIVLSVCIHNILYKASRILYKPVGWGQLYLTLQFGKGWVDYLVVIGQ